MPDDTDEFAQFEEFGKDLDDTAGPVPEDVDEEPPTYHSGRVRIIGAEPAGDTVREVTGPVVDDHPELPHWNDAPTGQVPAILDTTNGEEQPVAPPMWREEETDWEAQEEVFEPSMLSDDLPAVGALLGERNEDVVDVERQPWHFESDDTLVIPPEPGYEPLPAPGYEPLPEPEPLHARDPEPLHARARARRGARARRRRGRRRAGRSRPPAVPSRHGRGIRRRGLALTPPRPPEPRTRAPADEPQQRQRPHRQRQHGGHGRPRHAGGHRLGCAARRAGAGLLRRRHGGQHGHRLHRRAAGDRRGLRRLPACPVPPGHTARPRRRPVAAWSRPTTRAWRRCRSCSCCSSPAPSSGTWPGSNPRPNPCPGISSTVFVFVWVGAFGSFAALLLNPNLFPDRHGIAFVLAAVIVTVADDVASLLVGAAMGTPPAGALHQPEQELGGADRRRRGGHPGRPSSSSTSSIPGRSARLRSTASSWRSWPRWAT